MENPVVLVTGATGLIGRHLLKKMPPGIRIRCLTRAVKPPKPFESVDISWVYGDLADPVSLRNICEGVDTVIHMGAQLRTADKKAVMNVNVGGTKALVDDAISHNVKYFVYLSTENVLRNDLADAYAESKRFAEAEVQKVGRHLILRPCFIYGNGDHHGLGRLADTVDRLPVIPLFGRLSATAQPMYVDDFVEIILSALKERIEGVYTIAGRDRITLNQILRKIAAFKGRRRIFVVLPKFIWGFMAFLCDHFASGAGWGRAQMRNIYGALTHDATVASKIFNVSPRGLDDGLRAWFADSE